MDIILNDDIESAISTVASVLKLVIVVIVHQSTNKIHRRVICVPVASVGVLSAWRRMCIGCRGTSWGRRSSLSWLSRSSHSSIGRCSFQDGTPTIEEVRNPVSEMQKKLTMWDSSVDVPAKI